MSFAKFSRAFFYRTPPVAASVFLSRIKNLNYIALAIKIIKIKILRKKLSLPEVYLDPYKPTVTERFCENITSSSRELFSKKALS